MKLSGQVDGETVSVAFQDHPDNVGFPTYWQARGHGLFAANLLGMKEMSEGAEELNYQLPTGEYIPGWGLKNDYIQEISHDILT